MEEERLIRRKTRLGKNGPSKQLASTIKDLGDLYFGSGQLENALKEYTEQLQICESLHEKLDAAIAHRMIGEIHMNLGDYERSLQHQMCYVKGVKESEDLVEKQRAFATLGRTLLCLSETYDDSSEKRVETSNEAKKAFAKSLKICLQLEGSVPTIEIMVMRARLLLNLGLVLEIQKEVEKATEFILQAADLCIKHKLHHELHRVYLALGAVYERQEKFNQALFYYKSSSEVYDDEECKTTARISEIELLIRMGQFYDAREILVELYIKKIKNKELSDTIKRLLKILVVIHEKENKLAEETDNFKRLKLYENLGDAAIAVNCYEKAVEYYKRMLTCAEKDPINLAEKLSAALVSLAQTLKDIKHFDEALSYAERELELCSDFREKCRSAMFLAGLKANIKFCSTEEVEESYQLALFNANAAEDVKLQLSVLKEMQEYFFDTGATDKAKEMGGKIEEIQLGNEVDDSSASECPDNEIGGDIDLDELSDVEDKIKKKEREAKSKQRATRSSSKTSSVIKRNLKGETPLHIACIDGEIAEVEKLINAGHSVNVRDHAGWTPLHEAANHGYLDMVKLLVKAGANINDPGGIDCGNLTALHDAASNGHHEIIHFLIENNADVSLKTKDGRSVLDCFQEWKSRVEKLQKFGNLVWTEDDEKQYQSTFEKLRKVLPVNTSKSESLIDQDDDENESDNEKRSNSSRRMRRRWKDDEKSAVREFYKRTMEDVKNGNKSHRMVPIISDKNSANKAPLIDPEETVLDNWLEEDMEMLTTASSNKHSISRNQDDANESGSSRSKRRSLSSSCHSTPENERSTKRFKKSSSDRNDFSPTLFNNENSCGFKDFDFIDDNYQENVTKRSPFKKNLRQTSLLKDSGFSRNKSSSSFASSKSSQSSFKAQNTNSNGELLNFKIDVESKILKVKLRMGEDSRYLFTSLTNEVTEDFSKNTGCRAGVYFTTKTGDVLTMDNILNVIYSNEDVYILLFAKFVDLEIPPINERYKIICNYNQKDFKENGKLMKILKSCQHSEAFCLKGDEEMFDINLLLKSIEYEKNLKVLNLSDTNLFNFGDMINQILKQLNQLEELHLEGCDIEYETINCIDSLPTKLRVLNLSYNPFGAASEPKLMNLILPLRYLQVLKLKNCELKNISFRSMINNHDTVNVSISPMINTIDISWNKIDRDESEDFINSILNQRLSNLNLSYTGQSELVKQTIKSNPLTFITIETVEFSGCNLSNFDVFTLIERCQNLCKIIISNNPQISQASLEALLKRKPTLTLIDMIGCKKINEKPKDNLIIDDPMVCTVKVTMDSNSIVSIYWKELWGEFASRYELPFGTVVFSSSNL